VAQSPEVFVIKNVYLSIAISLVCSNSFCLADGSYTVSVLADPTGGVPNPLNISSGGIVGFSIVNNGSPGSTSQAMLWQGSQGVALPILSGYHGTANAINGAGDIVGGVMEVGGTYEQPSVWHNGQLQLLNTSTMPGGNAQAINAQGDIVGDVDDAPNAIFKGALWHNGQLTILGNFPGAQVSASSINNVGQVVLNVSYIQSHAETWVWSNGSMVQVGSLGGVGMNAFAINDAGTVVGSATTADSVDHSFIWKNGVTTALPSLLAGDDEYATAINNAEQIVGIGFTPDRGNYPLLWENGQVSDLNDLIPVSSGWQLQTAYGLGEDGSIVGVGILNGQTEGFLLTPDGVSAPAIVPEPASLWALGVAGLCLLRCRRSK
jgi:probable HAF family extracellular repeat protein